jgi:hypothetical protein
MIRQRNSFVTACGTALLCACATGTEVRFDDVQAFAPENGSLVTLVDYLESGRRAVDRFLQGLPAAEGQELGASIVRAREACVRIAVRHHLSALSYNQVSASGVLVAKRSGGPVVLTAGHSFDERESKTSITLLDGTVLASAPLARAAHDVGDWAILPVDERDPLPFVQTSEPVEGELAFTLGYPDQSGIDAQDRVVRGEAYQEDYLAPLVTILRVESTSPLVLTPIAGAVPLDGASGGGIFDRHGNLIANLSGIEWEAERDHVTYRISACPVSLAQSALD